jgi:hypothetical protein
MDPTEPYTSITVLLGDESAKFMGNVAGSLPPAAQNGNLYTLDDAGDSEEDESEGVVNDELYNEGVVSSTFGATSSIPLGDSEVPLGDSEARVLNDKNQVAYPSNILLSFPIHIRYTYGFICECSVAFILVNCLTHLYVQTFTRLECPLLQ